MKNEMTQQEKDTLTCALCGKVSKSLRGLSVHKSLSHKDESGKVIPAPATVQAAPQAQVVAPADHVIVAPDSQETEVIDTDPVLTIHAAEEEKPEDVVEIIPAIPEETPPPTIEEPEPEVKLLNPEELGVTEILVGSTLRLQGPHYIFDLTNQLIKGPEVAEDVLVRVNFRWEDKGQQKYYLRAQAEGGTLQWIVAEEDVLASKNVQLVSLSSQEPPTNYMPEIPTSEEVEAGPSDLEIQARAEFLDIVAKYIKARDAKLEAEKSFKELDKEIRPLILEYLETYGQESDEGKGDHLVELEDCKVHWTFTPGETVIKKDEPKILEFLRSNAYLAALDYKVNWNVWEKLKENGTIPPQFVTEVEQPTKSADRRKLLVEKL